MRVDKETIWHFVCKYCLAGGVSLVQDAWQQRLYCPHCGKINDKKETKKDEVSVQE